MSPNILLEKEKVEETKIEEETFDETIENVEEKDVEEQNTQSVNKNILKNLTEPLYVPKEKEEVVNKDEIKTINLFSSSAFEKENVLERKQLFETKPVVEQEKTVEIEEEQIEQPTVEPEPQVNNEQEQFFEVKAKVKSKNKSGNFRLKLFTAIFCVIMATTTGWVITNAVRMGNLYNAIESTETVYSANEIKLINNIGKLDDIKEGDPSTDATVDIIEEVITIQPIPLENPTQYQEKSNFFDALCNFISGLFGG